MSSVMLSNTTAFITGASRGIGREIATTFAAYGANVVLAARSDGIYETEDIIGSEAHTLPLKTDVSDGSTVEAAIAETVAEFGGLDCLVNNAGMAGPTAPIENVTAEEFRETLDVNLTGPFLCAKHAAPHLRDSDQASVVTISSVGGKRPYPNRTPYSASKAGVIGLSRTLSREFGGDDITVNTVCPGPVEGDRIERVIRRMAEAEDISEQQAREVLFEELAIDEFVPKEDVAECVAYLAGDAGRHVTAQDINVDSGMAWY